MPTPVRYVRARHLATMTPAGVLDDGCLAIEAGVLRAVGRTRDLRPPRVDEDVDGLLTPGLVNVHTHLELTDVPRPPVPGTFQDWLLTTMAATRDPDPAAFAAKRVAAVRAGVAECLRFGVTTVGDVTQNPDLVRPVLRESPLRVVSYGECLGIGTRRDRFDRLLDRALDPVHAGGRLRIGVSPHAPYTADTAGYVRSHHLAEAAGVGWTTHLAETAGEMPFVAARAGPFADLYRTLGFDPGPPEPTDAATPVAWLASVTRSPVLGLLAHVNVCTDDDLGLLAGRNATVAYCPRTHAYFGLPPHRWPDMLRAGVRVCVATDSRASAPDLNVMDDLRLLRRKAPGVPAATLWDMVTFNTQQFAPDPAAERTGVLTASTPLNRVAADFAAWPTRTADPLAEVLDTPGMLPTGVWIGGARVGGSVASLVPSPGIPEED